VVEDRFHQENVTRPQDLKQIHDRNIQYVNILGTSVLEIPDEQLKRRKRERKNE
jgi:hypothetical protein